MKKIKVFIIDDDKMGHNSFEHQLIQSSSEVRIVQEISDKLIMRLFKFFKIDYLINPIHYKDLMIIVKKTKDNPEDGKSKPPSVKGSYVLMSNGVVLPISKARRNEFISKLKLLSPK